MGASVRKSSFRLVFESTARRTLRSGELVGLVAVVVEEGGEAGSALVRLELAAFGLAAADVNVDWGLCLKVDEDEGRVMRWALGLVF
jgi:hypothetical protein